MNRLLTLLLIAPILSISAQTFTSWTTANGLPSDDVRDVAVAADGTLWFATALGVAAFDGTTFTVHNTTTHPGLANNDTYAIAVAASGDVWVGTDFGVSVYDGSTYTTYTTANGLGDDAVKNIKQAPNGDVWIATINGATKFTGGTFTAFGMPQIPFGGAMHIAFANNGDVLLSGGLAGVVVYNGTTFTTIGTTDGLVSGRVRSIAVDGAQNKWVATAEGISVLNASNAHTADHLNVFILPPPDELNPITDVVIDQSGRIWAGVYVDYLVTVGGVSYFTDGVWGQFEESDGLAGPNVRRLAVDADNDIWVTTSTGITEISNISIGMAERAISGSFALFPNPASSVVEIVRDATTSGLVEVELRDAAGRLISITTTASDRLYMDVSALDAGLYSVRIGDRVRKLLVQH
jgi:ligand-binding sensor domain-containing protein